MVSDPTYPSPFTVSRKGIRISSADGTREELSKTFAVNHCIKLNGVLAPDLLGMLLSRVAAAPFVDRVHEGIADNLEACMEDDALSGILHFLFNSPRLFRLLEALTGCEAIRSFGGRVYRFSPAAGHRDAWHDDLDGRRLLAMSLNLGAPYEGGVLEIRDKDSRRILHRASNTVAGDAVIFRLAPGLEHRVTPVTGAESRTAFAGWYQTAPDVADVLKELGASARRNPAQ